MATLEQLEQQKKELEKQIKEATKNQKQEDLKLVRQLCKRHGLTYSMLKNHLGEGMKDHAPDVKRIVVMQFLTECAKNYQVQ
jgi:hypothetical protein